MPRSSNAIYVAARVEDGLPLERACELYDGDPVEVQLVLERRAKATEVREAGELAKALRIRRIEAAAREIATLMGEPDAPAQALGELAIMVLRQYAEDYRAFRAQERAQAAREESARGNPPGSHRRSLRAAKYAEKGVSDLENRDRPHREVRAWAPELGRAEGSTRSRRALANAGAVHAPGASPGPGHGRAKTGT